MVYIVTCVIANLIQESLEKQLQNHRHYLEAKLQEQSAQFESKLKEQLEANRKVFSYSLYCDVMNYSRRTNLIINLTVMGICTFRLRMTCLVRTDMISEVITLCSVDIRTQRPELAYTVHACTGVSNCWTGI